MQEQDVNLLADELLALILEWEAQQVFPKQVALPR